MKYSKHIILYNYKTFFFSYLLVITTNYRVRTPRNSLKHSQWKCFREYKIIKIYIFQSILFNENKILKDLLNIGIIYMVLSF